MVKDNHSALFWEKVEEQQAKSEFTNQKADYIANSIIFWDNSRLEIELNAAKASKEEKEFYLYFLYPLIRKNKHLADLYRS